MKRKHRFVVGFPEDQNVVYGQDSLRPEATSHYTAPLTRIQAEKLLKKMPEGGARIYELVEVDE